MVRIVTDSTSDLPVQLAKELAITVVPLYVHFGSRTYRDGVDITTDDFYQRLEQQSQEIFLHTLSSRLCSFGGVILSK